MMTLHDLLDELDLPTEATPVHIHETARCERRTCHGPLAYRVGFRVAPRSIITVGLCAPCAEPALDAPGVSLGRERLAVVG